MSRGLWTILMTLTLVGCSLTSPPHERVDLTGLELTSYTYAASGDGLPGVRVFLALPERLSRDAPTLLVMPGMNRNAEEYRDDWLPAARSFGALIVVPEFTADDFDEDAYNLGGLTQGDEATAAGERTFDLVRAIVADAQDRAGVKVGRFNLFGHSAGAQFVHRMVLFSPADVDRAVSANAGWYTLPDDNLPFPYGLSGFPTDEDDLADAFAVDLRIFLGGDDIDPDPGNLRTTPEARAQGANRLERGLHFMAESRRVAAERDDAFNWGLTVVPGVSHDHTAMAEAAAEFLLSR